jgi:DUF1016 N-terminal domain
VKWGQRRPTRVEIVDSQRAVRLENDRLGFRINGLCVNAVRKPFLDQHGIVEIQFGLRKQVGARIRSEILRKKRAEYGEEILPTLSAKLTPEFGDGFSARNLARMIKFAEVFPDTQIVAALSRQLGWSHFVEIIPLKDQLQRDFYAEMCRIERWSVRKLREKIAGLLYERTAISRKPAELAKQELRKLREEDQITPDLVFRDPYLLDFLGLSDTFGEKDIEAAMWNCWSWSRPGFA